MTDSHDPSAAIAGAMEHAGKGWIRRCLEAGRYLAITRQEFHSGDIWPFVGMPPGDADPRAIGGIMRRLIRYNWIEKTNQFEDWYPYLPEMTAHIGRSTRIYRSKIFGQQKHPWLEQYPGMSDADIAKKVNP
jgi:hypothetical protein